MTKKTAALPPIGLARKQRLLDLLVGLLCAPQLDTGGGLGELANGAREDIGDDGFDRADQQASSSLISVTASSSTQKAR